MANHQIKFSCGHTEIETLNGNRRDRERRIKWMEQNMVCSTCYAQRKQEWREKNAADAAKAADERGLPKLSGTEKQIIWAETIRADVLDQVEKMITDTNNDEACLDPLGWGCPDESDLGPDDFRLAYQSLCAEATARFWIDNRNIDPHDLARKIIKK